MLLNFILFLNKKNCLSNTDFPYKEYTIEIFRRSDIKKKKNNSKSGFPTVSKENDM